MHIKGAAQERQDLLWAWREVGRRQEEQNFRKCLQVCKEGNSRRRAVQAGQLSERRQREEAFWWVGAMNSLVKGWQDMKPERVEPLFRAEEFGRGTGQREPGSGFEHMIDHIIQNSSGATARESLCISIREVLGLMQAL